MVNLALFRLVLPTDRIDQLQAFMHNMNPVGVPFGPQAIICVEQLLNLSRKASSITFWRAFLPVNEHKRQLFRTHNYLFGRRSVRNQDMIDSDEAGFKIESTNQNFGKTVT